MYDIFKITLEIVNLSEINNVSKHVVNINYTVFRSNDMNINLSDLLNSLSNAQDLVNIELSTHHHQVAYLSYRIANYLGLPIEEQRDIMLAGLLHDIGALTVNEKLSKIDDDDATALNHGYLGSILLSGFKPLEGAAKIIKFHHHPWNNGLGVKFGDEEIPLASHIIHIADRTCVMINKNLPILQQVPGVIKSVAARKGSVFMPKLVECLNELGQIEYIWLDLIYKSPLERMSDQAFSSVTALDLDQLIDFSMIFSRIIDFRSSFTANHSAGVAKTAEKLAQLFGYSERECKMMLIAGYLHDLGKLAVDNAILEKPGPLTADEFSVIKCHPFYTYRILEVISGFDTISKWAAYHHEKPNGKGYPFHLNDSNLPLGSKIVAAADVFTAITEDRPYRKSMGDERSKEVLTDMMNEGSLCPRVVSVLLEHFDLIKKVRTDAQREADIEYGKYKNVHVSHNFKSLA
jgi:HD-GYP domain-containing protein (c-di-GMP phosphodiesterase class II)